MWSLVKAKIYVLDNTTIGSHPTETSKFRDWVENRPAGYRHSAYLQPVYKTLSAQIGATVCDRSNLERENRRGSRKMAYYRQALWHSSMSSCPARSIRFELQKEPSLRF